MDTLLFQMIIDITVMHGTTCVFMIATLSIQYVLFKVCTAT